MNTVESIPFVEFLRMQHQSGELPRGVEDTRLSIPFVGFLRMQPKTSMLKGYCRCMSALNSLCGISSNATNNIVNTSPALRLHCLSIPFVGFLRMQHISLILLFMVLTIVVSLNSLCGISSNATEGAEVVIPNQLVFNSQFHLWDFFECNFCFLVRRRAVCSSSCSQFPLWDFFECNC